MSEMDILSIQTYDGQMLGNSSSCDATQIKKTLIYVVIYTVELEVYMWVFISTKH